MHKAVCLAYFRATSWTARGNRRGGASLNFQGSRARSCRLLLSEDLARIRVSSSVGVSAEEEPRRTRASVLSGLEKRSYSYSRGSAGEMCCYVCRSQPSLWKSLGVNSQLRLSAAMLLSFSATPCHPLSGVSMWRQSYKRYRTRL